MVIYAMHPIIYSPTPIKPIKPSYQSLFCLQSWITQWAKGDAAQGPQCRGAPKAKTKKFNQFLSVHAELTWDSLERM